MHSIHFLRHFVTPLLIVCVVLSLLPLLVGAQNLPPVPAASLTAAFTTTSSCADSTALRGIPTYESIGLYLDAGSGEAKVRYRQQGQSVWQEGLPLWYDNRTFSEVTQNNNNARHRGSLVHLTSNTSYEVQVLHGSQLYCGSFRTMNDNFSVGQITQIGNRTTPLVITEGGTASAYRVYEGGSITVPMSVQDAIVVNADYVIIRNVKISGPRRGITINDNRHDVVIEGSEITDWGTFLPDASDRTRYGVYSQDFGDHDGGINIPSSAYRITIQRNHIHTPRTDANTWDEMIEFRYDCISDRNSRCHPNGPRAINWQAGSQGIQRIVRYNTMIGTRTNMLEDVLSGTTNDTDFYGNFMSGFTDDLMEIDGTTRNVRVWGNQVRVIAPDGPHNAPWRQPALFSTSPIEVGPVFIWRNLVTGEPGTAVAMAFKKQAKSTRGATGTRSVEIEYGRLYVFHNTIYSGRVSGSGFPLVNVRAYNNVLPGGLQNGVDTDFKFNLTGGALQSLDSNFIVKTGEPGFNGGTLIPNFSDTYAGTSPDMGYQEAGGAALRVGHTGVPIQVTGGGTGATGGVTIPGSDTTTPGTTDSLIGQRVITTDNLNVRSGAGTTFSIIRTVLAGTQATIVGIPGSPLTQNTQTLGTVSTANPPNGELPPVPTALVLESTLTNLVTPSPNYLAAANLTTLTSNTSLLLVGIAQTQFSTDWAQVRFDDGLEGWVSTDYIRLAADPATAGLSVQVIRQNQAVYATPAGSIVTGVVPYATTGTIVGGPTTAGGMVWYAVQFSNGVTGWLREDAIQQTTAANTDVVQTLTNLDGFSLSDITSIYGQIDRGNSLANVTVTLSSGQLVQLQLTGVSDETAVFNAIAAQLGATRAAVETISRTEIMTDDTLVDVLFRVRRVDDWNIRLVYQDGRVEIIDHDDPETQSDIIIEWGSMGEFYSWMQVEIDRYNNGQGSVQVREIAELFGVPEAEARAVVRFEVDGSFTGSQREPGENSN